MNPQEVRSARECLGLTHEQLAAEYGVTEGEVRLWEVKAGGIPKRYALQLAWDAALRKQEEAMAASGLPECAWLRDQQDRMPGDPKKQEVWVGEIRTHVEGCETCQAREQFAEGLPPLPEPPMPGWVKVVGRFVDIVDRLPRWARPAAYGAAAIGIMTLIRSVFFVLANGVSLAVLGMVAMGIGAGAYLGAVGGLTYYAVRDPLRRFGKAAPYLTGIVVMVAYLLAFGLPELYFSEDPMLADPVGWVITLVMSVLFGLAIGHWWFRAAEDSFSTTSNVASGA